MNVAILTTVHPALDVRIFHKEAISLTQAGHMVTLYAPKTPQAAEVAQQHGIRYVPLQITKGRITRPYMWWQLFILLRQNQFDVWHFHDPELLWITILIKLVFAQSVKLIYDVHEDIPKDILTKPWIPMKLRKPIALVIGWLERYGASHCQLVISATDSIGQRMEKFARISIIVRNYPLIAQASRTHVPINSQKIRVIYCGVLTEVRGIRQLIDAVAQLQDCAVELLLLGEFYPPTFENEMRQTAPENVKFLGKVPYNVVFDHLESSHIGIVCLQPVSSFLESLPTKLFEYMQASLPVIASNFPLWREIVEKAGCGIVVDPQNPAEIANAIRTLATDPNLRLKMGKAGKQAVYERYSWQTEAANLIKAYSLITFL